MSHGSCSRSTFLEMQNKRPQVTSREIPQDVLGFEPEEPITLDRKILLASLKSSPRGSSPGPGGCTYEHLQVLLEDSNTFDLLIGALNSLAQATVPQQITTALMSARLTALSKRDGGVRGIATGTTLRRIVGRTLAKQFMKEFEVECSPFQYALSTRAGTDCVGHMLRAATDHDPTATVLKVDGIKAYDHVLRSAMLVRLSRMRGARALLPFVRLSYATPSTYVWFDNQGERRTVTQAEGGEQGDPLMPLLFSIGIQGALEEVSTLLVAGEQLCAFLDDVYIVCQPCRVRFLYDRLGEALLRVAGIRLHQGKTRVWNKSQLQPPNVEELGPDVWQPKGITVLGTPIGSEDYVREKMNRRVEEERRLWDTIPAVPDLQCAWQLLLQSANPRANHSLRTMPPSQSVEYARAHDEGIWQVVSTLLDLRERGEHDQARQVATLPMRQGLGLRSASRGAEAAYWASWADAWPMISERNPAIAEHVEHAMTQEVHHEGCLAELHNACGRLDREGMANDLQKVSRVNLASGNTAGSSGLLPSLTPTSGRTQFCHAVPPLSKPT